MFIETLKFQEHRMSAKIICQVIYLCLSWQTWISDIVGQGIDLGLLMNAARRQPTYWITAPIYLERLAFNLSFTQTYSDYEICLKYFVFSHNYFSF